MLNVTLTHSESYTLIPIMAEYSLLIVVTYMMSHYEIISRLIYKSRLILYTICILILFKYEMLKLCSIHKSPYDVVKCI